MAYLNNAINNVNPASRTEQVGIWIQKGKRAVLDQDVGWVFKWFRINSPGDITVEDIEGNPMLFESVQVGEFVPAWGRKILSAGTTGSDIMVYTGE